MADEFAVGGRIGDRWRAMGAERGALGRAIGPETDAEGRGRRQTFERGEICWSEDQKAIVTAYRLWNEAVFEWAILERFTYDYFRIDVAVDGASQGQWNFAIHGHPDRGRRRIKLNGYGEYAFTVRGCDDPDESKQGWTVPVHVRVEPTGPDGGFPVRGVIAERWHELGGVAGALGRPLAEETVGGGDYHVQQFEHGAVAAYPRLGPHMAVLAYRQGRDVVINWGYIEGAISAESIVEVILPESGSAEPVFTQRMPLSAFATLEWARQSASSGAVRYRPKLPGTYLIRVTDFVGRIFGLQIRVDLADLHLDAPQRGGTPGRAFATHDARVLALVDYATRTRTPIPGDPTVGEDVAMALVARLHALSLDPEHKVPGELPSHLLVNEVLKDLSPGVVGTDAGEFILVWVCKTKGEYDTFLKGLVAIVLRYGHLLVPEVRDHIVRDLLTVTGGHDVGIETKEVCCDFQPLPPPLLFLGDCIDPPESENHILLIETSRYLSNQILFAQTQDARYDNRANGLADWLLGYLHTIARHDFHEFNARPYQRYSLNALINLHEFASDARVRTAAQIVLDYTTTKFAVSSNRLRRLGPFRRLVSDVNAADGQHDDLVFAADPQRGFFLAYTGPVNPDGTGGEWIQFSWVIEALIAGLAPYRPPIAAYEHALSKTEATQHWLYHGERPAVRGFDGTPLLSSPEPAAGGIEIYYSSPSFLLTAGGMFVNSGYGHDELMGFKDVGAVQATTLLPTRADVKFGDVIRFDAYPDNRRSTNYGVHRGFACGANLRGLDKWCALTGTSADGPWIFLNLDLDLPGHGRLGFYVAAYRTPVADAGSFDPAPANVGLFHAMEATVMSFQEFETRTRQRNPALPAELRIGDTYAFRSADDHEFTFRLWPIGVAYLPIVHHLDGQAVVEDFRDLHLVDGPYLRSPNGHDGYFEIRPSGCAIPLVLDFRDRLNPVRTTNDALCPRLMLDRANALYGLGWELWNLNRHEDGLKSMRDRVKIFEDLAVADPGGFKAMLAQALVEETMFRTPDLPGAQRAGERAVTIYQELAGLPAVPEYPDLSGHAPNAHWVPLTGAFYFLAYAYWEDGKQSEGLRCMRNRVRVFERLASADPATFTADLLAARQILPPFGG
ncbi:LGFP repeat-containing protein [Sphaerisporangium corydalis]|uniref:LGFP repeat-containing protein n=1 Tax=Sphaerisporangium corydalis TaxID=1441875 RepID=A0ABV9E9R0_9ACTN|nr:hypothetical protein [Sphaerisporangium corydalis]